MSEGDNRKCRRPGCGHRAVSHGKIAGCVAYSSYGGYCSCRSFQSLAEPAPAVAHDGVTYDAKVDAVPLNKQQQEVYDAMKDGRFRSLAEIAALTGSPEASVSARLRDLRKPKWGGFDVQRRRRAGTRTWEYAVLNPDTNMDKRP